MVADQIITKQRSQHLSFKDIAFSLNIDLLSPLYEPTHTSNNLRLVKKKRTPRDDIWLYDQ